MNRPPPLYDTLYPIVVSWLEDRGLLNPSDLRYNPDAALELMDDLLDGEDGLGYRIWQDGYDEGRYGKHEDE